ncbi:MULTISPECIES: YveK family protein [Bacillaceae]|uniref:YveK family protein n=1 Tax=Bacillaceae TaxID=186817 RepID=UPI000C32C2DA|nr:MULTISPECIES: Wzz/FepE/Etk N-terminal domain-containing protein [Bacillaceae]MCT4479243.1 Wzz/FepE/Etk N-terminal domain-containing protein [Peribacillus frigoritolerans]PKF89763.1 capsular biosynthesis protein [Bacillus sp. BA3]
MAETLNIKDLFQMVKKRIVLIIIITTLLTAMTGIVSFFILSPVYQASTQILVNQSKEKSELYNVGEIQTNIQLIETYSEIIKSPMMLEKVKERLNLDISNTALSEQIKIVSNGNSQIFTIKVEGADPKITVSVASAITDIFQDEIKTLMNVDNVNVLSKATIGDNSSPIKPNPIMNTIVACFAGLIISLFLTLMIEFFDKTIKVESDIEEHLKIPMLGIVNLMENKKKRK